MTILAIDDHSEAIKELADTLQAARQWYLSAKAGYGRNHPAGNQLLTGALPVGR